VVGTLEISNLGQANVSSKWYLFCSHWSYLFSWQTRDLWNRKKKYCSGFHVWNWSYVSWQRSCQVHGWYHPFWSLCFYQISIWL